ncbi:MAG TPA: choice-of-anchor Q domain-containing protein [Methylomirabilota bacterium]|nr:choice-of-anchor Q domain-containing protein [Methylomirabilota bacterium]
MTHPLRPGSPAVDAGHSGGLAMDQRGGFRPVIRAGHVEPLVGDGRDIGAFESGGCLKLIGVAKIGNDVRIQFTTDAGNNYRVERRDVSGGNYGRYSPVLFLAPVVLGVSRKRMPCCFLRVSIVRG